MSSYVKFETPADLVPRILKLLTDSSQGGKIRKGVNDGPSWRDFINTPPRLT